MLELLLLAGILLELLIIAHILRRRSKLKSLQWTLSEILGADLLLRARPIGPTEKTHIGDLTEDLAFFLLGASGAFKEAVKVRFFTLRELLPSTKASMKGLRKWLRVGLELGYLTREEGEFVKYSVNINKVSEDIILLFSQFVSTSGDVGVEEFESLDEVLEFLRKALFLLPRIKSGTLSGYVARVADELGIAENGRVTQEGLTKLALRAKKAAEFLKNLRENTRSL